MTGLAVCLGLECVFCHIIRPDGRQTGLPGPQLCAPCHEALDVDKEPEDRIAALFDASGRYARTVVATLPAEVRFFHSKHVREFGIACADCHGDIATSAGIPRSSAVPKNECLDCHEARGRKAVCADCHTVIDGDWKPGTHDAAWKRGHGEHLLACPRESRDRSSADRCELCHDPKTCMGCHLQEEPRSHTNYFRVRGHGILASIDRDRCWTCHRDDSCTRCHESTAPRSHRAGWGSPTDNHCLACHQQGVGQSCATCHKGTPSHDLAAPMPSWHNAGMNCRQCHYPGGQPLPHPDNGLPCTECHR